MATVSERPASPSRTPRQGSPDPAYLALVAGLLLLLAGGLSTVMAGAVRWQECFGVIRGCEVMSDAFDTREGFAEPLGVGMVLTYLGVVVLSAAVGRWWVTVLTALSAAGLVVARSLWSPEFAEERAATDYGPVQVPISAVEDLLTPLLSFGALALLGLLVLLWGRRGGPRFATGVGGVLVAVGLSWWMGTYTVMAVVTDAWDAPTHWWTVQGAVAVISACVVLARVGRPWARPRAATGVAGSPLPDTPAPAGPGPAAR